MMIDKFKKILFFSDGARGELAALRRSCALALHNDAELTVIGVVDEVSTDDPRLRVRIKEVQKTMIRERSLEIDSLISQLMPIKGKKPSVKKKVVAGKDYIAVIEAIKEGGHDVLIKSVNPQNAVKEVIFGNTDIRLMHYAPCPVMILKPSRRRTLREVLAAVNPNAKSEEEALLNTALIGMATSICEVEEANLHVLHVLEHPFKEAKLTLTDELKEFEKSLKADTARKMSRLLEEFDHVPLKEHLVKGKPATAIAKFVKNNGVDLLVMGSVARSGVPGLLVGNTAEKILDKVDCSVMVMKPKGWKTPIS
jgi:nucleotide-binding universal stress UspA family protein